MSGTGESRRHLAALAMGSGITVAVIVLVVLLDRGWESAAWTVAGATLVVTCIASCAAACWIGERSSQATADETARLAETRRRTQP